LKLENKPTHANAYSYVYVCRKCLEVHLLAELEPRVVQEAVIASRRFLCEREGTRGNVEWLCGVDASLLHRLIVEGLQTRNVFTLPQNTE
jgi:hypothetical protein